MHHSDSRITGKSPNDVKSFGSTSIRFEKQALHYWPGHDKYYWKCPRREKGTYCIILEVSQTFDRICHERLLYKLNKRLPKQYVNIQKYHITNQTFRIEHDNKNFDTMDIIAGVLKSIQFESILYILYTWNLPVVGTEYYNCNICW